MCRCVKSYKRWAWTSRRSYTAVMSPKGLIKSRTKSTGFIVLPTVLSLSHLCLPLSVFQSFISYSVPSLTPLSSRAQLYTTQWEHPLPTSSPFSISYFHFTLFSVANLSIIGTARVTKKKDPRLLSSDFNNPALRSARGSRQVLRVSRWAEMRRRAAGSRRSLNVSCEGGGRCPNTAGEHQTCPPCGRPDSAG